MQSRQNMTRCLFPAVQCVLSARRSHMAVVTFAKIGHGDSIFQVSPHALQGLIEALNTMQLQSTTRVAGGSTPACSNVILSAARHAMHSRGHEERTQASPAGRLQPSLRCALSIVEHPDAFLDGFVPGGAKERTSTGKKGKRRRKRRKGKRIRASGIAGLEQRAAQDSTLQAALHELKWGNSICTRALDDLAPRQVGRASNVPAQPLGFQARPPPP
jgi:hypothetical protein